MQVISIEDAEYRENPLPSPERVVFRTPLDELLETEPEVPWYVRSTLHSLRNGAPGWDDELAHVVTMPEIQLHALVNQLLRVTEAPGLKHEILNWHARLKAYRASRVTAKPLAAA